MRFGVKFMTAELERLRNVGEFAALLQPQAGGERVSGMLFNSVPFIFVFLPITLAVSSFWQGECPRGRQWPGSPLPPRLLRLLAAGRRTGAAGLGRHKLHDRRAACSGAPVVRS